MKQRFILYRRKHAGIFYVEDTQTKSRKASARKTDPKPKRSSMLETRLRANRS